MNFRAALLSLMGLLLLARIGMAADPDVTANLTNDRVELGQATGLNIVVSGARSAEVPRSIDVDGLQISQTGQQTRAEMNNFDLTITTSYSYTILPMRAGTFKIPGQRVTAGGKQFQTPELTLQVVNGGGGSAAPLRPSQPSAAAGAPPATDAEEVPSDLIAAELVIPGGDVYLGQAIPVELRIHFDSRVRAQAQGGPTITGDGFTTRKFLEARVAQERRSGRPFEVVTFRTSITPVKAGKLQIGPGELGCVVVLPESRQRRGNSPFDDLLNSPFPDPFGMRGTQKQITIRTDPVELDVKALPVAGRPAGFSGAVGQFQLEADVQPRKGAVGDPITITSKVKGRGDFDRLAAPVLESNEGLREYPASSKFLADDDLGLSGSGTFEQVVIPEKKVPSIPGMEFSYFDPVEGKYQTLRTPPVLVQLTGEAAQAPAPAAPNSSGPASSATPTPSVAATPPVAKEIYHIFDTLGPSASFTPYYRRTEFWAANAVGLILWAAVVGGVLARRGRRLKSAEHPEWKHELALDLRSLAARPDDATLAVRAVSLAAAIRSGGLPEAQSADTAVTALGLGTEEGSLVRELFARRDAAKYSGGASPGGVALDARPLIDALRRAVK